MFSAIVFAPVERGNREAAMCLNVRPSIAGSDKTRKSIVWRCSEAFMRSLFARAGPGNDPN
jgi:hypothetical protein